MRRILTISRLLSCVTLICCFKRFGQGFGRGLSLDSRQDSDYRSDMADLKFEMPVTQEVKVDKATLARIDRGVKDADEGRTVPLEEVRKMIPQWITKFESQKSR